MYCWWCSVSKLCLAICESMDCSMPASFVLYYLLEFCPNSCPLSQWCHPTTSSSFAPFSSFLWSFPASQSFPVFWFFASGGQIIGASTSASVLPMNIQSWFPLGLTGLISLLSKGLSRVFCNTTFRKITVIKWYKGQDGTKSKTICYPSPTGWSFQGWTL